MKLKIEKQWRKITETKNWFSEEVNKIDKIVPGLRK